MIEEQVKVKINYEKFSNDFLFMYWLDRKDVDDPLDEVLVEVTKLLAERGVIEIPYDKL